jgi:hypothetical protein
MGSVILASAQDDGGPAVVAQGGTCEDESLVSGVLAVDSYWRTLGNAETTPGTHFVGTTDAKDLVFKVQGLSVMRFGAIGASSNNAPNIVGGHVNNSVTAGVTGAVIAGGGYTYTDGRNLVTDHFGVVGGGAFNVAGNNAGTVSDRAYATVGGGYGNRASAYMSVVAGGRENVASGEPYAAICGGYLNDATGSYAVVSGGYDNTASGEIAAVGGGRNNSATALHSVVAGGYANVAAHDSASVCGGRSNAAYTQCSHVGGGCNNSAWTQAYATVSGGYYNSAGASATVAGGQRNEAEGAFSMVPGGFRNKALADASFAAGNYATVSATHNNAFVWSGSPDPSGANSMGPKTVTMRGPGGFWFYLGDTGGQWVMFTPETASSDESVGGRRHG